MNSLDSERLLQNQRQLSSLTALRALLPLSLVAAVPAMVTLTKLNERLQNPIAPLGVVSFELARTVDQQIRILDSWTKPEQLRLAFSIGLDFLCVLALVSVLTLACMWLTETSRRRGAFGSKLGLALAWAPPIMGIFWMLQNVLLAAALFGHTTAQIVYWCALLKFAVITIGLAYVVLGGAAIIIRGRFRGVATPD